MKLYKYQVFNHHTIKNLLTDHFWFSHFKDFNDPYEALCIEDFSLPCPNTEKADFIKYCEFTGMTDIQIENFYLEKDKYKHLLDQESQAAKDKFITLFERFSTYMICCCFSAIDNELLMWSHYSDGLRGFCIEFDSERLILDGDEMKDEHFFEVAYLPDEYLPKIRYIDYLFKPEVQKENYGLFKRYTTKSKHWSYEKEYRLIRGDVETDNPKHLPQLERYNRNAISSIIIGEKISDQDFFLMKNFCTDNKIRLKRAKIDAVKYKINIEDV